VKIQCDIKALAPRLFESTNISGFMTFVTSGLIEEKAELL